MRPCSRRANGGRLCGMLRAARVRRSVNTGEPHVFMRRLLSTAALAAAACAVGVASRAPARTPSSMRTSAQAATQAVTSAYDILIRRARIVDGSGSPWYRADIAIAGDRIEI